MKRLLALGLALVFAAPARSENVKDKPFASPLSMNPQPIAQDASVKYDFDIVYVRAPRKRADGIAKWAEVGDPRTMEPGADLMLLHPDGTEGVLVPVKPEESICDPYVGFDGKTVYFAKMHDALKHKGADIYKVDVPTKKVTQLTNQTFTPNTGVTDWAKTKLPGWGVYNLGPCPLPGNRLAFVSDRNAYKGVNTGYAPNALALQLFTMNDDGTNVECIGFLNLGMALHPNILKDGRIMFSSLESQGLRSHHLWGVWSINPDGTNWGPLFSAFEIGNGTADSTHFQAQLSDGSIVVESYYNLNNFGFGTFYKFPVAPADGYAGFGPGYKGSPQNNPIRHGRYGDGRANNIQFPFSPYGVESLTPFIGKGDWPSEPAILNQKDSPRVGKFTHPSSAPDNHCLCVWSPGSVNSPTRHTPAFDSGIYLIKGGRPVNQPGDLLLIKNDPKYHEQWPRALVSYKRIYGIEQPQTIKPLANDGKASPHLPEGVPAGLVGTSSLYKRESYPYGVVKPGTVTATYAGEKDPTGYKGFDNSHNWTVQGSDAGLYDNDEIHAIRIVALEPTTELGKRSFYNHVRERIRILGEVPIRKFACDKQPLDPDGNPDTSFLVKVPADIAWTFQTLDKNGLVLNMAQTWHQLRPGEIRNDCGGCHAHSQKPTLFKDTAAAKPDYVPFDLTKSTPLITTKAKDESGRKWDAANSTGLRFEKGVKNVEYHRDIKPILERSCVACHSGKSEKPAAGLVLDDDSIVNAKNPVFGPDVKVPGTYARLAADKAGTWGVKPLHRHGWRGTAASRYIEMMQSRRSLLIWKIFGKRLDGFSDDDIAYEATPGDPTSLTYRGRKVPNTGHYLELTGIRYSGGVMPPPEAVAEKKVAPLTDEDKATLVRWIDLGCPIDLDPQDKSKGWLIDDNRPTVVLTLPHAGVNGSFSRILLGMHDFYSGLDMSSLTVTADFTIDGAAAGENLAGKFKPTTEGVWEWKLAKPIDTLAGGKLTISVKDRQGNTTKVERLFSVGP